MQKLAEDLEKFRIFSRNYISFSPDQQKLTIYALADQLSFAGVSGSESSRRVIGRFENTSHGSFALINLKGNQYLPGNPARQTLFHEYMHFLTYGSSQFNFPYWFSEGVAEVFSTVSFDKKGNFSVGGIPLDRAISLHGKRELPLKELLRAVPGSLNDQDTEALYASGWMLSHWLIFNAERNDGLSKFLQAYNRGEDPVNALPAALGMTFDELAGIYQKLPKVDFNTYKGRLTDEKENYSLITSPMDNREAIAEIAHYMAITDQNSEVLRNYISYAEKKGLISPELMSALSLAEAKEKNYSSAREILGNIEDKYQDEIWYLEATAMVALYEALDKEKEINVPEFKKIRDSYVELVNAEGGVPAYWHELAITMQVLGYPRPKYVNMLEQAYLRAPRDINIAWWYAHELYLNRDVERFSRVSQPLLMQITRSESREHLESMIRDLNRETLPFTDRAFTDNSDEVSGLGQLMKDYQFLSENKALAMALDYRGAFVVGYIDNVASQTEANQLALQACEEQRAQLRVKDRCELYAEGETIIRSP
ncbi:hypothetical protein ACJJID_17515 [Microbulbifer sp. CnH-101-G]|uniref:hypothetical protein n=1 Tax=Microbulbifer sp. CnH-101-G TaxID=3243393 RepID=UPI00403A2444